MGVHLICYNFTKPKLEFMQTGNDQTYYFRAADINALYQAGATHIMVTITPAETGGTGAAYAEGYTSSGKSAGPRVPGCPWPCGGGITSITSESLEQADKNLSNY
jgi:hypothetical protein